MIRPATPPVPRPFRSLRLAAGLAAALAAGPLAVTAAAAEAATTDAEPKPPTITVVPARQGTIVATAVVTGTLRPKEEIIVNAEIDGLAIEGIMAEEGDHVVEGQELARLSQDTVNVQVVQADAQIARAVASIAQAETQIVQTQATLKQAQNAFARTGQLRKTGTASVEAYETREAEAQVAEAKVAEARQALALAQADKALAEAQKRDQLWRLSRTVITAPATGVVSRRTARLGAVVATAGEPLFRLIEDGSIELEAEVAETTLARLKVGQTALVMPAGHTEPVPGRIRLISPEIDATTRLGRVRIALETKPGLSIGAFAYGTIEIARDEGVLLPISAVLYESGKTEVLVVVDGKVEAREVELGLVNEGTVEIRKGVAAGEPAVAISGTFLRDGDRVTPVLAGEP